MKILFTTMLILLISISTNAQNKIKGTIIDNENKSPLSYASITLHSLPDSASLKGMVSANDGSFLFNNISKGKYYCKVKFMGYHELTSNPLILDGQTGTMDMGQVIMEFESKNLKQIDIVGERLKGVEMVDRTVYTISEIAAKTAGNGTDILKRIPSVQVDLSNNISLQGSSNIIILVDGKERDQNFIAQLDPKTIDKVEISTNPSAKYDASITGVISIVLKKEKRLGISGNVDLEIPTNTDHYISSPSASIDYGYNKLRIYTSANSHFEGFKMYKDFDRESGTNKFTADGAGRFYNHSTTFHYGFDYFINDKNNFSFYANYNPSVNSMDYLYQKYMYNNNQLSRYYTTGDNEKSNYKGQYYSVFYKKGFKNEGHEITTDIGFFASNTTNKNTYIDQYYQNDLTTPDGNASNRFEIIKPSRRSINTKIDYKLPINDKTTFEAGFQNYDQIIENGYSGTSAENSNFKFKEIRNAGYAQLGRKIGKWNLRAGLRYELSLIYIDNSKNSEYDCILPNATIQFSPGKNQSFKLSYRRSIRRPGINELNPYTVMYDSMNISKGNPDLKPAYNDKFQLNYSKNVGSNFFGPELFFTRNTNMFQRVVKVNENNVLEMNTSNLGKGYEYGIGFSGTINATKWLLLNPYVRVYRQHIEGNKSGQESGYDIPVSNNSAWQTSMYAMAKLPKGFALWTYATYNSPTVSLQNTNYRDCLYVFGVEKTIMKDKGKIGINWYEPFKTKFRFNRNVTENQFIYQDDDNFVRLSTLVSVKFTYHFNRGKEVKKLDRQKNSESDAKGGLN
jgi:outer membrane receptor protein involved in Fe transport